MAYEIDIDELKRKIRKLKKLEIRIRSNYAAADTIINNGLDNQSNLILVWDDFFDLHEVSSKKAKYSIHQLVSMSKEEYKEVLNEYFYCIYYQVYKENGIVNIQIYDPDVLAHLGLNYDAGIDAIKKRFRELAKKYHPDTGGDSEKFIHLMENYRKLIDK